MSPKSSLRPARLAETALRLRTGQQDLLSYLQQLLRHMGQAEPQIQAFVPEPDRRGRLWAEAEALLERYPDPPSRPPLFGVPIGVKDIFAAEGFPTQAGSQLPASLFTRSEAASVKALRAAGALIMGKTVTTEFAFYEPGPTRNPHHLAHTPGGSSSGSAAAVAAGMIPLALGTQTIGSVIRPASFCGIVGYKPTYNRIDPEGLIFFSRSADHVGLFTQDVEGMVLAASLLCQDWRSHTTTSPPVLGVPEGAYLRQADASTLRVFAQQIAQLEARGYRIVRVPLFSNIHEINAQHRQLIAFEFAQEHEEWFDSYRAYYRPRTAALIREGQAVPAQTAAQIRDLQPVVRAEVARVMDVHQLDLWICPAAPGTAPAGLQSTGDPVMNLPWSFTGMPAITLPGAQTDQGLPLGLQLVAKWEMDESLLAWAQDLQRALELTTGN